MTRFGPSQSVEFSTLFFLTGSLSKCKMSWGKVSSLRSLKHFNLVIYLLTHQDMAMCHDINFHFIFWPMTYDTTMISWSDLSLLPHHHYKIIPNNLSITAAMYVWCMMVLAWVLVTVWAALWPCSWHPPPPVLQLWPKLPKIPASTKTKPRHARYLLSVSLTQHLEPRELRTI